MSVQTVAIETRKVGTCPHGNPAGACPLCSGMGGGGNRISSDRNTRRRPGEMTWNECYAMGLRMKRQREAKEAEIKLENIRALQAHRTLLQNIASKISQLSNKISAQINKLTDFINKNIINKLSNTIQNIPTAVKNTIIEIASQIKTTLQDIKQKLIDISDKLAAIYGEMKNAIEKKLSELFKTQTEKITSLFGLISFLYAHNEDEESDVENEVERILRYKEIQDKGFSDNEEDKEEQKDNHEQSQDKEQ